MTLDRPTAGAVDRGSGTVLVLAVCAVLVVGITSTGLLAGAALARHHAQASADLAALAAADVLLGRRTGDACAVAARVASANGGRLAECRVLQDGTVRVSVRVQPRGPAAALGSARVEARAGPAPGG